jgi:hypothetical protein
MLSAQWRISWWGRGRPPPPPPLTNQFRKFWPKRGLKTAFWVQMGGFSVNFRHCCLHMYFLWRHHLSHNKSENDQDSDSESLINSHIVLTYDCWHCFSVSNISLSHALEMTIHFYSPTLELFCFTFTQPFTYSKFCLPNPSLFGATPCHK